MKVWLSGASGGLGSEVVKQLEAAGHQVVPADLDAEPPVDLQDVAQVRASMTGCDAIVHLAAIPAPGGTEPSELLRNNTLAAFNAFEQAWDAGIRLAVTASSAAIYGLPFGPAGLRYPYLPVDEDSPLQYTDEYALSKDITERVGHMYARRGMTVTALRFHWILPPDEVRELPDLPPGDQLSNLWGYVDRLDAARACVLGLTPVAERQPFEACLIVAADTARREPTEELVAQYSAQSEVRRPLTGTDGLFDCSHARRVLGWTPSPSTWR